MRKKSLQLEQVMSDLTVSSEAEAVGRAAGWANALLEAVHRGPSDNIEAAMHRAERAYGVPATTFWALRYRPPKVMAVAAWLHLKSAYDNHCAAQGARLRHELEMVKALPRTPDRQALIDEAEAVLRAQESAEDHDQSREWPGI